MCVWEGGELGECLEVSETNKSPGMDFKQSLMAVDCEIDNIPQIITYDQSATPLQFIFFTEYYWHNK